jgi:hypothetical protein
VNGEGDKSQRENPKNGFHRLTGTAGNIHLLFILRWISASWA